MSAKMKTIVAQILGITQKHASTTWLQKNVETFATGKMSLDAKALAEGGGTNSGILALTLVLHKKHAKIVILQTSNDAE